MIFVSLKIDLFKSRLFSFSGTSGTLSHRYSFPYSCVNLLKVFYRTYRRLTLKWIFLFHFVNVVNQTWFLRRKYDKNMFLCFKVSTDQLIVYQGYQPKNKKKIIRILTFQTDRVL